MDGNKETMSLVDMHGVPGDLLGSLTMIFAVAGYTCLSVFPRLGPGVYDGVLGDVLGPPTTIFTVPENIHPSEFRRKGPGVNDDVLVSLLGSLTKIFAVAGRIRQFNSPERSGRQ